MPRMVELKEYEVDLGWMYTTMQLFDEVVEKYGDRAKLVEAKKAAAPANKARRASDK